MKERARWGEEGGVGGEAEELVAAKSLTCSLGQTQSCHSPSCWHRLLVPQEELGPCTDLGEGADSVGSSQVSGQHDHLSFYCQQDFCH
jgi:hypothetical protein